MIRALAFVALGLLLAGCDTAERAPPGKRPPCNREAPPNGCFQVITFGSALHSSQPLLITVEGSTPEPASANPFPNGEQVADDIESAARFLRNNPEARATLDGHSNAMGSEEMEKQRSQQAADFVRDGLLKAGIDSKRLKDRSFGAEMPMLPDARNDANWRVEVFYPTKD